MTYHQGLADRWRAMPLVEQMANIGSEVDRALNWKAKSNNPFCQKAVDRALELLDLSLQSTPEPSRRKELSLVREGLVDYFSGPNQYRSTDESWHKYFLYFALALRKNT